MKKTLRRIVVMAGCIALLILVLCPMGAQMSVDPGQSGPYAVAHVTITATNPNTGSELVTDIYYPSSSGGVDPSGAPYPTLVFAHGLQASRIDHSGNGQHLASWGYIVAIPDFPDDDIEVRASDIQRLFSYLEAENANMGSLFSQKIDTGRFGMAGHSLGGLGTLMTSARDARINLAAVPLDPVNPPDWLGNGTWDFEGEAPDITAPIGLIGAPAHTCNWDAQYNEMIPYIGATHVAKFVIVGGGHCDFLDGDDPLRAQVCGLLCGVQFSQERSELAERYTTAWFNYYLRLDTDFYAQLYGDQADQDIQAGRITRYVRTAPRGVAARGRVRAVGLTWTLYDHPIIAGYNIYRSQRSGNYPSIPYAQVGRVSSYVDTQVVPGRRYFYVLRSRDAAGNEHQPSDEVSAVPTGAWLDHHVYLLLILKSR